VHGTQLQSRFRARHSTETATLKVLSDILAAADQSKVTLLGLLDMLAAFDTVEHAIPSACLEVLFHGKPHSLQDEHNNQWIAVRSHCGHILNHTR